MSKTALVSRKISFYDCVIALKKDSELKWWILEEVNKVILMKDTYPLFSTEERFYLIGVLRSLLEEVE